MAKRPAKKPEKHLDLPTPPPPTTTRTLPMQLQVGDRLTDETGEWEVIGHPYTTNLSQTAHVRVRSVDHKGATQIRSWGSHEHISVKRASAEEGKR